MLYKYELEIGKIVYTQQNVKIKHILSPDRYHLETTWAFVFCIINLEKYMGRITIWKFMDI